MKVLIVSGGVSAEREVSLKSAAAVLSAAKRNHQAEIYDWDGTREWLEENISRFDVVLPIMHGAGGEDGAIQTILEDLGAVYLGSDAASSALCFNKQRALTLFAENGITVPVGRLVSKEQYLQDQLLQKPHVLKPFDSGSSVDTFIYPSSPIVDRQAVDECFERHPKMLLEEYITGVEIAVPILEGKELPVIEVVPPEGGVFDYENKYNGKTLELTPPQNVSDALQQKAQQIAAKVHQLTGCRHLSRVDMIISGGEIYVLESNTMPGMTDQSLYPKCAAVAGLEFPDLVDYFITLAYKEGR